MTLGSITSSFIDGERRDAIKAFQRSQRKVLSLYGLAGSSAAVALAAFPLRKDAPPMLVVGDSADDAGYIYHDLTRLCGDQAVAMFPSGYRRDIRYGQADGPSEILRTEALNRWHADDGLRFVVTYPEAIAERVASRTLIDSHTMRFDRAKETDMMESIKWLRENGFTQVDYVYEPGQFASRGSILDIFGYNSELPLRIDFFGDEIDSIRRFNVETQLSEERLDSVAVTSGVACSVQGESLLRFIPDSTLIALRDEVYTAARVRDLSGATLSANALLAGDSDSDAMSRLVDPDEFDSDLASFRKVRFSAAAMPPDEKSAARGERSVGFNCSPQTSFHKNFELIGESFRRFISDGYTIYILSDNEKQTERLRAIFDDRNETDIAFTPVVGTLHEGFVDKVKKICVFTDHQIFDRFHKYNLKSDRARSGKLALSLKELSSIEPGDYIVHVDHGIGRFAGLLRTEVNGRPQEMIKLIYANDDIIFVSIHALHKLAKYRGKEGVPPKISKLGTGAWTRMKERTKAKLKDIARDLIKLYAERRSHDGFAFSPDSYMQQELEASFIYEDTPDQMTATAEVKADMESSRPMDRLICGDVGFGKTEIAIRAAFKAAADSKQTAVLVPTTVLAYQHFNTFSRRLKDFPVRVDYLSRARTPKQVKAILDDLAAGRIDIIVGTHKLIGKSVKFKDLGLLVIDEEQKFGVAVKERLKQLKVDVDTLTMSATPIPRTLQFSLMGARDLSAITTPPANRYPIVTEVSALTDETVAEAINFEMSRNGQVFIINNHIEGLNDLEAMVKRLVPDARIIVAHGRMAPEKLEKAILDFANHDYDILLATTIVESGIDMPNVNTIIVNNAQNFGLSELHQLRGRVGRSSRKAFCYLTVPKGKPLTDIARRRLQAIESFSDLGSGINIAMQDLDIRGAGNLLGAEQSGFIADLGYETYQKILQEAVTELRSEEFADLGDDAGGGSERDIVADCVIESDMELMLPYDYVPGDSERIALYQQLDSIERETDLQRFRENLIDRFGKIPTVTAELLRIPRLRRLARRLGIEKVSLKQGRMLLYLADDPSGAYASSPMLGRIISYSQANLSRVEFREKSGKNSIGINHVTTVEQAVAILEEILAMP